MSSSLPAASAAWKGRSLRRPFGHAALEYRTPGDAALGRTDALVRHGRFALNHAISGDMPDMLDVEATGLFDPGCNWICDKGDADAQR